VNVALPHPLPEALVDLIARRFRAMSEPTRIRILDRLRDGEATTADLVETLDTSQQNVSKHLAVLAGSGLIGRRRDGNKSYYRITDESVLGICEQVCGAAARQLAELHVHLEPLAR
jgi:DNA-binding transcriptional ArsR family regulator